MHCWSSLINRVFGNHFLIGITGMVITSGSRSSLSNSPSSTILLWQGVDCSTRSFLDLVMVKNWCCHPCGLWGNAYQYHTFSPDGHVYTQQSIKWGMDKSITFMVSCSCHLEFDADGAGIHYCNTSYTVCPVSLLGWYVVTSSLQVLTKCDW